ncbi:hypothetical protein C8R45DRAFT_90943 [Mycena sanguinolenta]|nr:hypothetical protein C8R45DRAFT_90943 [Mycena sanguinolenta]
MPGGDEQCTDDGILSAVVLIPSFDTLFISSRSPFLPLPLFHLLLVLNDLTGFFIASIRLSSLDGQVFLKRQYVVVLKAFKLAVIGKYLLLVHIDGAAEEMRQSGPDAFEPVSCVEMNCNPSLASCILYPTWQIDEDRVIHSESIFASLQSWF